MSRLTKGVLLVGATAMLAAAGPVRAGGIVFEQLPNLNWGHTSDTSFYDPPLPPPIGQPAWAQTADDFVLDELAVIRRLSFWGFYGSFEQPDDPPAGDENMRVRFYATQPDEYLPDDSQILFEESILNPSRTPTGKSISGRQEFLYELDFSEGITFSANTTYWLEVVQVDDIESRFRWETGVTHPKLPGFAVIWSGAPIWQHIAFDSLAFGLSTVPEPGAIVLVGVALILVSTNRRRTPMK